MALNQFPRRSFVGSSTLQTFTGDGTQTAFTLSSAQTQNEVFLFVDDVAQVPGVDFTVSGTTLTFTSAPTSGAEIIARGFGVPAPVTTVSDGSVTAAKLATGAIEAKLGYTPVSPTQLSNEVAALVDSAPTALNTLNELAAALGDDANYASTITTALGTKANASDVTTALSAKAPLASPTFTGNVIINDTGALKLPTGTTAQRPSTPSQGMIRQNSTNGYIEYWDISTSQWVGLGAFQATGGTITTSGNYTYHAFTTSGTFTVTQGAKAIELIVVAGGGGAGDSNGSAGAGAGGLIYQSAYSVSIGSYAVVIGGGGSGVGGGYGSIRGYNGANSSFGSLTAIGGGGSGTEGYSASNGVSSGAGYGAPGGSGGGSVRTNAANTGGRGTSGQGNNGGSNINDGSPHYAGGGGGGAGAAGADGSASGAGAGGAGLQYTQFASWGSPGGWFAGGGGGANYNNSSGGSGAAGGNGGGAAGGSQLSSSARNGVANTGGGGGGHGIASNVAGSGGSGIVLIRYLT